MRKFICLFMAATCLLATDPVSADPVALESGQTSILLDFDLLSVAGLDFGGFDNDVILPGNLGPDSFAFSINGRDDADRATTFTYDSSSFTPVSGTIEHSGSLFFNLGTVAAGNLSVGYDPLREVGPNSGFFASSTFGLELLLFDLEEFSVLDADSDSLEIQANLLISPELAFLLQNPGLAGTDIGDVLIEGQAIPEPTTALVISAWAGVVFARRRRA
ncbi:MAG: hypothetical protein AAGA30_18170 [Planctomycetota bacterium]